MHVLRSSNLELTKRIHEQEAAEAEAHSAKAAAAGHAAAARNALSMHPNLERDISTYQNALNDAQHALKRSQVRIHTHTQSSSATCVLLHLLPLHMSSYYWYKFRRNTTNCWRA